MMPKDHRLHPLRKGRKHTQNSFFFREDEYPEAGSFVNDVSWYKNHRVVLAFKREFNLTFPQACERFEEAKQDVVNVATSVSSRGLTKEKREAWNTFIKIDRVGFDKFCIQTVGYIVKIPK